MVLVPGRNNVVHVIWYDGRVSRVQFDPISRYYCQHLYFFRLGFFFSADCQPSSSVLVFEAPQLGDSLAAQRELRDIVEIHPFEQCFVAMRRDKSAIFWGRDQEPQVFRDVTKVGVTKRGLAALKLFCISEKFYFVSHDVHRPLRSAVLRPFGCVRTETIAL